MTVTVVIYFWRLKGTMPVDVDSLGLGYPLALVVGAVAGGYGFGSFNLILTGVDQYGRSIVGALTGAIFAVEVFKWRQGIRSSTGLIFVPGFCTSLVVGRFGCFFSGLEDWTHGTATSFSWGYDFGDGVLRHPVQLYESGLMAAFLLFAVVMLARRSPFFYRNGFYLMVGTYAFQRFWWEFLKPYATPIGPFNTFHFLCAGLMAYALVMLLRNQNVRT